MGKELLKENINVIFLNNHRYYLSIDHKYFVFRSNDKCMRALEKGLAYNMTWKFCYSKSE